MIQPGTSVGWHVKLSMQPMPQPLGGQYVLVAKCSCGDFTARLGGDDAWERVTMLTGIHVKSAHMKSGRSVPVSDSATERPDDTDATR